MRFCLAVHGCYQLVTLNNKSMKLIRKNKFQYVFIGAEGIHSCLFVRYTPEYIVIYGNNDKSIPKQCYKSVF